MSETYKNNQKQQRHRLMTQPCTQHHGQARRRQKKRNPNCDWWLETQTLLWVHLVQINKCCGWLCIMCGKTRRFELWKISTSNLINSWRPRLPVSQSVSQQCSGTVEIYDCCVSAELFQLNRQDGPCTTPALHMSLFCQMSSLCLCSESKSFIHVKRTETVFGIAKSA